MHLQALWRYPVKSMGGETLTRADLTTDGIPGDRLVHVADARGPLTGRTRAGLLTLPAGTGADGQPHVDGHPWRSAAAARRMQAHAGPDAELRAYDGPERFDVTNLLVVTDGELAALPGPPVDVRRLRPNLMIGGVVDRASWSWPGHALRVGQALIGVYTPRQRCIVTSIDPDSGCQDLDVFRRIRRHAGNEVGLNCWVIAPGKVQIGDSVEVVRTDARPRYVGGWIVGAPYQPHHPAGRTNP